MQKTRAMQRVDAAVGKVKMYEATCGRKFGVYNKTPDPDSHVEDGGQGASEALDNLLAAIGEAQQYGASQAVMTALWSRFQSVQEKTQSL